MLNLENLFKFLHPINWEMELKQSQPKLLEIIKPRDLNKSSKVMRLFV